MIPTLSGDQLTLIRETVARFTMLVQIDLESGTMYLCSAARNIVYGGNEYLGVGHIATIDPITEKTAVEATSLRLGLSGVPLSMRSLALQEDLRGRECRIYMGFFDDNEQPVGVIVKEFSGQMSAPAITTSGPDENGERTAEISIAVETAFTTWARGGRARRHTHEDQQFHYPGDRGYEFADAVSTVVHLWGVPR